MPVRYVLTEHARLEMMRRGISAAQVNAACRSQSSAGTYDAVARCSSLGWQWARMAGCTYLRVFLDVDRDPPEVVTVYRTSKVGKYWR